MSTNNKKTIKSVLKSKLNDISKSIKTNLNFKLDNDLNYIKFISVSDKGNIKIVLNIAHSDIDMDVVDSFKSDIEKIDDLTVMYQSNVEIIKGKEFEKTYIDNNNVERTLNPSILVKPVFEYNLDDNLSELGDLDTV